jgi:DNA-binding CsgD family transcriptional regulator
MFFEPVRSASEATIFRRSTTPNPALLQDLRGADSTRAILCPRADRDNGSAYDAAAPGARLFVLCVESNPASGGALSTALEALGYAIERVSDGEDVRKKLSLNRPSLVFYDASTLSNGEIGGCVELIEDLSDELARRDATFLHADRAGSHANIRDGRPDADDEPATAIAVAPFGEHPQRRHHPTTLMETGLTRQERNVLTWVARGKTSSEIGLILGLSERTINFHCANAMRRLDVIKRTQAVAKALAAGMIVL